MARNYTRRVPRSQGIEGRGITVFVDGHDEVVRKMRYLKGSRQRKAMRAAVTQAVRPVRQAAKKNAPRESGILRKSLTSIVRTYAGSNTVIARVGVRRDYRWFWGNQRRIPEMYINALNKGTVPRRTRKGAFRGVVSPNRFLVRAARQTRAVALSKFNVRLRTELNKAFNRL